MTPATYARGGRGMAIAFSLADCGLGRVLVAATERGVSAVYLGDRVLLLGGTPATITQSYDSVAGRPRRRDQAQVTEAVSRVKRGLSQSFEDGAGI